VCMGEGSHFPPPLTHCAATRRLLASVWRTCTATFRAFGCTRA
jgi:hypothetical protein